jgi:hypothetical protein
MPDALSIGGEFVLYKPEGAANYFFFDHRTGARVYGADLERAKILAEANGLKVGGTNFNGGGVYVRDGEMTAWQALHPDAPTKSMPDPGHFQTQFPPETLREPSKPPLPEPTAIEKQIEEAKQAVERWDRYGEPISRVRQLEKGTMQVPEVARKSGYNSLEAVRGYRQLVVAYPVVENVSPEQRQGLKKLAGILEKLENDELYLGDRPSADTIKRFIDGKMQALEKEGEIFLVTGHSRHFNITRIQKMPDGSYTSTLYDAGGETKIIGTENGRKIAAAVQENRIKPGTDIREMLEAQVIKKDARAAVYIQETKDWLPASDEYTNARKKIESVLGEELRTEPELAQRRGNCTTRGQRIMAADILKDEKLSEGLYDFASNTEGTTTQDIRNALQRKVEYLEAIRDGADPQNAWRQLDVDNYAKATDLKTYELKTIELDGGGSMEVYRTKPGAFNVNELDNLQGTLKRNGVDAVVRQSVKNPDEYYLYVPKEDAPKIAEALKSDNSPAADLFRQYGPKAKDHIEVRNFVKASDLNAYDMAKIQVNGGETIDIYRTKPGLFNKAELDSLRATLQRNGVNATIRESTTQPGEHYLYVPKEDAAKFQKALKNDQSPAADLYRRYGNKAPEMVDGYVPQANTAPLGSVPKPAKPPALSATDMLKAGVWKDDITQGGAYISRIDARNMSAAEADQFAARLRESGFKSAEVKMSESMGGRTIRLTGDDAIQVRAMRQKAIAGANWQEATAGNETVTRVATKDMTPDDVKALRNALEGEGIKSVNHPSETLGDTIRVKGNDVRTIDSFRQGSMRNAAAGEPPGGIKQAAAPVTDAPTVEIPRETVQQVRTQPVETPAGSAPRNTGAATAADDAGRTAAAAEDATKTSRFLKEGEELGRTARIVQKLGAAEETVAATNAAAKTLGTVAKGGMAVVGVVGAGFAVHERVSGTGYTRLLEANGLDDNSSAVFGYKKYQEGNIGDATLMAIPTGATQALGMLTSGIRYAVGDVDHGKLLATIIAKDPKSGVPANGRSKEEIDKGLRNAVTQYVDSAVWYFHHLNANQRRNIIDNVLVMKENGQLKDWSQLPALVGNSKNITYLWNDPKGPYTQSGLENLKLPDAEKTREVMREQMGAQLQNAMEIESKRLEAKMPDIDWTEARERFMKGGAEAAKKFIDGEMSVKMPGWNDIKEGFFKALEIFDADLTIQKTRNLINRPLDLLSSAFLDMTTGAGMPDGKPADLTKPMVLDEKGNYRTLTDEDIQRIREAKPDDPDAPHIKYLKIQKDKDGKNIIAETDLTKEQLDAIQSGQMKLPSAAELIKEYQAGAKPELTFQFPDATTLEDLQKKMDEIEAAKDPAAKDRLQKEFNELFVNADADTRRKFIEAEKTEEQNAVVEKFIEAQKELKAQAKKDGADEENYGLGRSELDGLLRSNAEKLGIIKTYQTGLNQTDYVTAGGRFHVHQVQYAADLNNDGVFGEDDKRFLEKYGKMEFSVTTDQNGRDSVNRVNSKMFGAFEYRDGAYVPVAQTSRAQIEEMKKAGPDKSVKVDMPEPPPPPVLKTPKP